MQMPRQRENCAILGSDKNEGMCDDVQKWLRVWDGALFKNFFQEAFAEVGTTILVDCPNIFLTNQVNVFPAKCVCCS